MKKSALAVLMALLCGFMTTTALAQDAARTAMESAYPASTESRWAPETIGPPPTPGILLNEGFEGGIVPPTDWSRLQTNPNQTWKIMTTGSPYAGSYSADCEYDSALGAQNELLISPPLNLISGTLDFWSFGSIYWCRDAYNNCDLRVWLIRGEWDGGTDDDRLVGTADADWTGGWTWSHSSYDLTPLLTGGTVRIGFQYQGTDGAEVALDAIQLNGELETKGTLNGHVYNSGGAPLVGAAIQIQGGPSTTTDADGFYTVEVEAGTWDVTASATGYLDANVGGLVITASATTTPDFYLDPIERVTNGSFEAGGRLPTGWTGRRLTLVDKRVSTAFHTGARSFLLNGNGSDKSLSQTIALSGSAGQSLSLAFWCKARGVPLSSLLRARLIVSNGGGGSQTLAFKAAKGTHGWRKGGGTVTPSIDYSTVKVVLQFKGSAGKAWFDDISLVQ